MYGEGGKVYLSHMITKKPDFQQVITIIMFIMSVVFINHGCLSSIANRVPLDSKIAGVR
jgi:hypothetical protein